MFLSNDANTPDMKTGGGFWERADSSRKNMEMTQETEELAELRAMFATQQLGLIGSHVTGMPTKSAWARLTVHAENKRKAEEERKEKLRRERRRKKTKWRMPSGCTTQQCRKWGLSMTRAQRAARQR